MYPFALRVVGRGDAILGDHHGLAIAGGDALDFLVKAARIDPPAHHSEVSAAHRWSRQKRDWARGLRVVIIDAENVADIIHPVEVVGIAVNHRVVDEPSRVERRALPPRQRLDAYELLPMVYSP